MEKRTFGFWWLKNIGNPALCCIGAGFPDYFPMQKVFVKYNSLNNNIINTYLLLLGDRMGTKNDIQNAKMNKCIYRFLSSLSIGVNYVLGRGCYFLILF